MSVLQVTGLRKNLGTQEVLRGADLRVDRGEKVGCVGRNGEGKTTLLRLIEGQDVSIDQSLSPLLEPVERFGLFVV